MELDKLWKPLVAEIIGMFMLCFVGGSAGALAAGEGGFGVIAVALAHGLILIAIVYTYGAISGAHVNPAVTFGLVVARKLKPLTGLLYWIAQFVGAMLAGLVLGFVLGPAVGRLGATRLLEGGVTSPASITPGEGLLLEALMTFFLVSTVLQAAVNGRAGQLAGVAIGLTYAACILMGGPLTGASLNPARTFASEFGLAVFGGAGSSAPAWDTYWIYLAGPFLGALLAGLLHGYVLSE